MDICYDYDDVSVFPIHGDGYYPILENEIMISYYTANKMGISQGDIVKVSLPEGEESNICEHEFVVTALFDRLELGYPIAYIGKEYHNDYSDGWEVRITCKEFYYTKDLWDRASGGFIILPLSAKRFLEETDAYDHNNNQVESPLCDQIAQAVVYHRPVCIGADGLNVMDDVGGVAGFSNFLTTIHEGTVDEMEERKSWARTQGWSGRMQKPAAIL